ncbi:hypothetical protein KQX54_004042 [Cotesia glomerata]|uniref:Uncharacterized protein n=1 Tax=Cotesia glomerata TaxID=32391 RepID=A0AAV7I6X8_COTGL|nr:hypothetical protein KQX54_004042 [Cotesia glomerata]
MDAQRRSRTSHMTFNDGHDNMKAHQSARSLRLMQVKLVEMPGITELSLGSNTTDQRLWRCIHLRYCWMGN